MSRLAAFAVLLAVPAADAAAQHQQHAVQDVEHDQEAHASDSAAEPIPDGGLDADAMPDSSLDLPRGAPPSAALSGPAHAADTIFDAAEMAAAREQLRIEQGASRTRMVLADRFEARAGDGDERMLWDLQGWYGGDIHKLWWKSEGAGGLGSNPDHAEVQALYSRAITPYFDLQAGVRHDFEPSPERSRAVLGVQGVLPYVFEIDAAAFVSEEGDLTGRFEGEYDLRIRQRLVLQPRVEMNFSAQAIPELRIGSGLGSIEGGLRLRYELRREIAPYVGLAWERKLGATADLARGAGEDTRSWELIVGVRAWF